MSDDIAPLTAEERMTPYDAQEQRVCDWIQKQTRGMLGCGADPIGFLLASYEFSRHELHEARAALAEKDRRIAELERERDDCGVDMSDEMPPFTAEEIAKIIDQRAFIEPSGSDGPQRRALALRLANKIAVLVGARIAELERELRAVQGAHLITCDMLGHETDARVEADARATSAEALSAAAVERNCLLTNAITEAIEGLEDGCKVKDAIKWLRAALSSPAPDRHVLRTLTPPAQDGGRETRSPRHDAG